MTRSSRRLMLEPLEDRFVLSTCHVAGLLIFRADTIWAMAMHAVAHYCINFANSNPGPDTIDFNVTGTIQLTGELPHLSSYITMTGPGADLLAVRGPGWWARQIFRVSFGATVAISGITITHSYHQAGGPGGIYNLGTLTLKDCTVSDNSNLLFWIGRLRRRYPNKGNDDDLGLHNLEQRGVFHCRGSGGAIANLIVNTSDLGVLNIENSTISGNKIAIGFGGGIYNEGLLDIRFSTVTNNGGSPCCVDGRGIYNSGSLHLYNSIVAGNDTGPDVSGSYTGSDNLIGGDPMLGPLQNNGGHTMTHALLPGSPAIDAGDNTGAPAFDQRGTGFPRIVNGTVDIGAYEVQATNAPGMLPKRLEVVPLRNIGIDNRKSLEGQKLTEIDVHRGKVLERAHASLDDGHRELESFQGSELHCRTVVNKPPLSHLELGVAESDDSPTNLKLLQL